MVSLHMELIAGYNRFTDTINIRENDKICDLFVVCNLAASQLLWWFDPCWTGGDIFRCVLAAQWSNHGNVWPTKWSNYAQDLSRHSRILWGCYWLLAALKTLGVVQPNFRVTSVSSYQRYQSKSWQTDFPGPFTWESFQDLGLLYQPMVVHAEEDEVPPAVSWLCKEMRIHSTLRHGTIFGGW